MENTSHQNQAYLRQNIKKLMVEKQAVFYRQMHNVNLYDADCFDQLSPNQYQAHIY